MNVNYLIIFLLCFISCSAQQNITEFERVLGAENSKMLTTLVLDFENDFLKNQYPDISTDTAYEQFLRDLIKGNGIVWEEISSESRNLFDQSKLKLEVYSITDSVWFEHRTFDKKEDSLFILKARRKYIQPDGSYGYGVSEQFAPKYREPFNKDSIIQDNIGSLSMNYVGAYFRALNSIPNKSNFMMEFLQKKDAAGILNPVIIANRMLKRNVDFNDYFIKRLILMEIVY